MQLDTFKNFTILYVEDETFIRTNVETCLKYFFNVISAKDGKEGLEKFQNEHVDLIITDINMPYIDGIEMINKIKITSPNIPCIITSAYDKDFIKKANEIGVSQYISKPFDIKDLLNNSVEILKACWLRILIFVINIR